MPKRHLGYMTVDVDLGEALSACTDEMLLQEVDDRKLKRAGTSDWDPVDDLSDARDELLRHRPAEALAILDRLLRPKWSDAKACEIALRSAIAAARKTVQ